MVKSVYADLCGQDHLTRKSYMGAFMDMSMSSRIAGWKTRKCARHIPKRSPIRAAFRTPSADEILTMASYDF